MPIYSFQDTDTKEVFDIIMSVNDLDQYKKENPTHERYFDRGSIPSIVSGVSLTGKLDDGFKDVLSKISEAHPDSPFADRHGKKSVKQVQTERAVRKWKATQGS
jgi:hypothetical protein